MIRIGLFLSLISLVFCSCNEKKGDTLSSEFEKHIELTLGDSVFYELDSITPTHSTTVQYFEDQGKSFLFLLNDGNNSVNVYDPATGKSVKVIKFDIEGPNGVDQIEGFYVKNFDTIVVNSRYRIFLADSSAKPYYSFDFFRNAPPDVVTGLIANESRRHAVFLKDKIYFDMMPDIAFEDLESIRDTKVKFVLDLKDSSYTAEMPYPESYYKDVYGIHYLMYLSSCYDTKRNRFVYSFPASPNLYVKPIQGDSIEQYYAGSTRDEEVPYLPSRNPSKKEYHQHFFTHINYDQIMYDEYRNLFYRIIMHPMSADDFNNRRMKRDFSIVVLDSNLNKVGEVLIEKKMGMNNGLMYISPQGLMINKGSKKEDQLTFYTYKATTIK